MGWAQAITGGIQLASGLFGANQQKKAANASKDAAAQQLAFQQQVYNNSQANYAPYLAGGQQGLAALMGNQYEQSPGYDYLKSEMIDGLNQSAAAKGNAFSGGQSLDIARHVNGLAAQDYGNWWNRQMGLAQLGQNSAAGVGSAGQAAANGMASGYQNMADAKGTGYGANAAAVSGLGGLAQSWIGGGSTGSSYGAAPTNFGVPMPGSGPLPGFGSSSSGSYFG